MTEAVGFVMAGGSSSRMGSDKSLLAWGESTLLDLAIERLDRACAGRVRILCGREPRYQDRGLPVEVDLWPDHGPLGGVLSGLSGLERGAGLFLASDLPFVPVGLLRRLLEWSRDADAVVPVLEGRPQPLCAVYGVQCLPAIRRRVADGELKMTSFWPDVAVRPVSEHELGRFGEPRALFRNVNTPDDYQRLRPEGMSSERGA